MFLWKSETLVPLGGSTLHRPQSRFSHAADAARPSGRCGVAGQSPVLASAKILNLYPLPNIPGTGQVSNFLYNGPLLNRIDQGDVRFDYRTTNSAIFGRYSKEDPTTTNPGFLPAPELVNSESRYKLPEGRGRLHVQVLPIFRARDFKLILH